MRHASWFLLLAAGCSTPEPPGPVEPETPGVIESAGPDEAKLAEDLFKGRTAAEQQAILASQRHYELALSWFNRGDFEKAKVEARESVRLWIENLAARKLLSQVYEIIAGSPPGGLFDLRPTIVGVEQAQIEITNHMIHGERFFNARLYESAVREFESALLKISLIPADVKAMNDLRPRAQDYLLRSKNAIPK